MESTNAFTYLQPLPPHPLHLPVLSLLILDNFSGFFFCLFFKVYCGIIFTVNHSTEGFRIYPFPVSPNVKDLIIMVYMSRLRN